MEPEIPYDLEAERAALGACLLDRDAITVVRDFLSVEDFYLEKNGLIYAALLSLFERRVSPDLVTVAGELRAAGHFDLVGGLAYLSDLCLETPTAVNVESYAKRVVQASAQRRIVNLGAEIRLRGLAGGDTSKLFAELRAMLEITEQASTPKANWKDAVIAARELYGLTVQDEPFVIDQILPQGTMLITGKPKTRKTWLAFNLAWAVASGGKALGRYDAMKGDALYIDLEMGRKRLHKRLHVLSPEMVPPKGLQFATYWPAIGAGFETWLRDYLHSHPFTRLVVVDTLIGVRASRKRYEDPYEADKKFTQALTDLCHEFPIAMVVIHHSRKDDGSDVIDDASGSTGLTGGVDNFGSLRLDKNNKNAGSLYLRGRDIEMDGELGLSWDARFAQWNAAAADEKAPKPLSPERADVLGYIEDRPGLKTKELALLMRRDEGGLARLLSEMKKAGQVFNSGARWFIPGDGGDGGDDDDDAAGMVVR